MQFSVCICVIDSWLMHSAKKWPLVYQNNYPNEGPDL